MDDIKALERFKICSDCGDCLTCREHDEALEFAIKALEKQIPKKAIDVSCKRDFNGDIFINRGNCPVCNEELNNAYNYCCECGQMIDWSE